MAHIYQDIEAAIPHLRRYARALVREVATADDLVQECLARALAKQHLWQEGTNLRAWLVTILHNLYVNEIRRNVRTGTTVELSDAEPALSRPADQEKCLELRDLERALARLPEGQRALIVLVGLEGMSYQEAATMLGMPVGTVRSRVSRARCALRRIMAAGSYGPPVTRRPQALPGIASAHAVPPSEPAARVRSAMSSFRIYQRQRQ
jgi:RNA polymerase sigma-70 factor (ECF subfamily)